jgi:kynurenine formamidase
VRALRIIDLSVALEDNPGEPIRPQVEFQDHEATAPLVAAIFGCEVGDLPEGKGWGNDTVTAITHAGTHVDAPWHYFPTCAGAPARTIDQLPLEWFIGPGVRLDLRDLERGTRVLPEHLERAGSVADGDIVLLWTGADAAWGTPEYPNAGCGLSAQATEWLLDRGVRVIGTDAWGLDRPLLDQRESFAADGDAGRLWEAHRVGVEREYCQIEKLHNLGALPGERGFTVSCLPVKITGASAGWCRAVAVLDA